MTQLETYPQAVNGTVRPAVPQPAPAVPHTTGTAPLDGAGAPPAPETGETARVQDSQTITKNPAASTADREPGATIPLARKGAPPREQAAPPEPGATPKRWSARAMRWVIGASAVCAAVVAGIGFVGSYDGLRSLALRHGFGDFAYAFPVGIDAGIVAMYGLDLVLVWRRMPKPLLRLIAHMLTAATIVFNAASGTKPVEADPLGAAMHGVLPVLFVAVVEAVRHLIIRTNKLVLGAESDTVPLHRWILSPFKTWSLYRRMKLWQVTSYARMVEMEKDRTVYRAWLQHKYGRGWKKKAGAEALLPFTMASFGLSVDESLALPRKQQEDEDRRQAAEAERIAAAAAAEQDRALDAKERNADARIREMAIDAKVTTAEHTTTAGTLAAEAEAKAAAAAAVVQADTAEHTARLTAEAERKAAERAAAEAERIAQREEQAEKTAAEAEAEARTLAARRAAEEHDRAIAEAAATVKKKEAEAAEADRKQAAEAAAAKSEAERLEAERLENIARQKTAERVAAEEAAAAAVARETAARAELAAQEAEDIARLSPRERAERKVARMILAAHAALPDDQRPAVPDMYAVSLEEVGEEIGVSRTVASERRQAAADLIAGGYAG
ncbi:DUF2637 domain-containing protein [Streptomyces sp. NPDC051909]|uniref:DUF2637 domain-containing protein n=1 Tax=Streptomyces sp. NPDC051909 TaxID=3154944 RepID=UPI0034214E2F